MVKVAKREELSWINSLYREIEFKESVFENETIVIAYYNGERAGVGRLQHLGDNSAELGGIYILPEYRGKGLAREVVSALVKEGRDFNAIFCLPFSHLREFYSSFGFNQCSDQGIIPEIVVRKHRWCNSFYQHRTLLMAIIRS